MPTTIFFSWQADTETRSGRNLVERALERAASRIGADTEVEEAVREIAVDRDTKNVPGSPPIVDTIFRKIDNAGVFVPDLTFVGKRLDGRPTPNPNVLVEYGWALKALTHARIVPVMNTAYGEPVGDAMPFDMRHLRNPITYHCSEAADEDTRRRAREDLAKKLESALRAVFESDEFKISFPRAPAFQPRAAADGKGRFKPPNEPIGMRDEGGIRSELRELYLSPQAAAWFRLMPITDPGRMWSVDELEIAIKAATLLPLSRDWPGYDYLRTHAGLWCVPFPRRRT